MDSWWQVFFHEQLPQPNLELFRFAFGLVVALYYARRFRTSELCLGPYGLAENLWNLRRPRVRFSPFVIAHRRCWVAHFVFGAGLLGSLGVMLGFQTQASAVVLFVVSAVLNAELSFLATGVDFIVLVMSGLLALSEAGAGWGLDAPTATVPATPVWATRLMQLQVCLIYLYGVGQKLSESQWRSGWAVYYAVHALGVARSWSHRLAFHPLVPRCLSWATIATQLVAPWFLWRETTRPVTVVALVVLHLGLEVCLRLWPFQWLMIACLLLFITPADLSWLL